MMFLINENVLSTTGVKFGEKLKEVKGIKSVQSDTRNKSIKSTLTQFKVLPRGAMAPGVLLSSSSSDSH